MWLKEAGLHPRGPETDIHPVYIYIHTYIYIYIYMESANSVHAMRMLVMFACMYVRHVCIHVFVSVISFKEATHILY
jgi:hypothetical protein